MRISDWSSDVCSSDLRNSFSYEDLLECGHGRLFGPGNAQLPLPPMLMFDRITRIDGDGGANGKGSVVAELDIRPDLDRKSVVSGKSVSVRVDLGGRRINKKKKSNKESKRRSNN